MAEKGDIDVKFRASGVLEKLEDCFGELHEIMADGSSEERSDLVSSVREMVGALETGLKRVPEKQEESELKLKRVRSTGAGICTHTCVHHEEIVNPELWSKLTEDLVAGVSARLPIPRIIELRKSSKAWAAMSDSTSFKSSFAEANPKLLGLLGWNGDAENFRLRILDATFKEWHAIELDFLKGKGFKDSFSEESGYRGFLYACDSGLVCFIPEWEVNECFDCVFVGNPLTETWRRLPDNPFMFGMAVLVQLVTTELFYQVILVYVDGDTYGAFVYESRTRLWSAKSAGLVYGSSASHHTIGMYPIVFDCATKQMIYLDDCAAIQGLKGLRTSILKDRLFVLHMVIDPDLRGDDNEMFVISEFVLESSRSDLRKRNDYEVAFRGPRRYVRRHDVEFFTSTGFILSTSDIQPMYGSGRQVIRIYDVSTGQWRDVPPLIGDTGIRNRFLEGMFMCELRWDANP